MRLEYSELATQDILEAWTYYENQQSGLGTRFLQMLDRVLQRVKTSPQHYSYIDATNTRRDVVLRPFPYLIVFEVFNNAVLIHRVFNTHQNPDSL